MHVKQVIGLQISKHELNEYILLDMVPNLQIFPTKTSSKYIIGTLVNNIEINSIGYCQYSDLEKVKKQTELQLENIFLFDDIQMFYLVE